MQLFTKNLRLQAWDDVKCVWVDAEDVGTIKVRAAMQADGPALTKYLFLFATKQMNPGDMRVFKPKGEPVVIYLLLATAPASRKVKYTRAEAHAVMDMARNAVATVHAKVISFWCLLFDDRQRNMHKTCKKSKSAQKSTMVLAICHTQHIKQLHIASDSPTHQKAIWQQIAGCASIHTNSWDVPARAASPQAQGEVLCVTHFQQPV